MLAKSCRIITSASLKTDTESHSADMSINGYLNLGTALSGQVITPPPSGAGYSPQPVVFNTVGGGVALNGVTSIFGPVSGSWGTLTCFSVTDVSGNVYAAGTLQAPYTPLNGQLVQVPQGSLTLVLGSQFSAAPAAVVSTSGPKGPTTSGSVVLASGGYTNVLASGSRNMILLQNTDPINIMQVILGPNQPPSGATGYAIVDGNQSWPPPSFGNFVPTDAIWVMPQINNQVLNYITG